MDPPIRRRARHAVHALSLRYLLVMPVLLAVLTGYVLFLHGDTNIYMLYSQCRARARIPWLSHVPVLGGPACFVVSFFGEAVASSARAFVLMAAVLSFVAGLLTVSTVEAARICNSPSTLIACPTGPWLVFDLVGGAIVWELVIIPAFFHRSRAIITARRLRQGRGGTPAGLPSGPADPTFGEAMRHLATAAEAVAIPAAVAAGYVAPALAMLFLGGGSRPAAVLVWLFFPVWVSLARRLVRRGVVALSATAARRRGSDGSNGWNASLHLESNWRALLAMYAVPVACSALSHALLLWSLLTQPDDRREMARATTKFVVINAFFVGLTVLYWVLVEAGWRVALVMAGASLALGPGAGVCLGWIYREQTVDPDRSVVTVVAVGAQRTRNSSGGGGGGGPTEDTPLLR